VWHYDIQEFIKVGLEHGADVRRKSFDIFPQVSIPNLFMEYVLAGKEWWMICPYEIEQVFNVKIIDLVGDYFKDFYENTLIPNIDKLNVKAKINAKELLKEVIKVQHETGLPYIFFKDTVAKYNQNTGTIYSTNLCTEYLSPTVPDELISVCNLAAINLANVRSNEIVKYAQLLAKCLDLLIDYTEVPINEGKEHNNNYRTIGIGIVGLADYLAKKNVNYHTGTNQIIDVFEKLAYGSLLGSVNQAKVKGAYPYYDFSSYRTKYLGKSHSWFYELDKHFKDYTPAVKSSDWEELFKNVQKYGVRNSELTCLMPNTSTALLQGCTASFLPVYAKLFNEKLGKGSIPITPKYLNNKFSYYTENITFDQSILIDIVGKYIQPFISMGISMELLYNLSLDYIDPKFMFDNIIKAWELDCKTIYYIRSKQDSVGECTSCAN